MNTTQLECFVAVANFLNFSRAAEQLRITQPAVSYQVNTLEDELGAKLFERTSKAVRLTQAGYLFWQYANDILKLTGMSKARVKESLETLPQVLGIGCRNFLELRALEPVLHRFHQAVPHVQPQLRLIPFASLENLLEDGEIQVLFTLEQPPSKGVFQSIRDCPLMCYCSPRHPLADRESVTVEALQTAGSIAICAPQFYPPTLSAIQSKLVGGRNPRDIYFCDNLEIAYTMAEAGYCHLVMPALSDAPMPGLCAIPMPDLPPMTFGAFYREGTLSPALRQFLKLVEAVPGDAP